MNTAAIKNRIYICYTKHLSQHHFPGIFSSPVDCFKLWFSELPIVQQLRFGCLVVFFFSISPCCINIMLLLGDPPIKSHLSKNLSKVKRKLWPFPFPRDLIFIQHPCLRCDELSRPSNQEMPFLIPSYCTAPEFTSLSALTLLFFPVFLKKVWEWKINNWVF